MAKVEERVAILESQGAEQARMLEGIRETIVNFELRMDRRFELIEQCFSTIDQRFAAIDHRFSAIEHRFTGVELRLSALDQKLDQRFAWLVGIQVITLIAIVAAILAR